MERELEKPASVAYCPRTSDFRSRQRHPYQGRHVPRYEFISTRLTQRASKHAPGLMNRPILWDLVAAATDGAASLDQRAWRPFPGHSTGNPVLINIRPATVDLASPRAVTESPCRVPRLPLRNTATSPPAIGSVQR